MSTKVRRTFELSAQQAAFIDAQVASGAFASADEVVGEGLSALEGHDVEDWMLEEAAAAYREMKAHPERAIPIEDVLNEIRALHAARTKTAS